MPRHKEARIVKFTVADSVPGHLFYGITGNMSPGGCWLYTTQSLQKGDTVIFQDHKSLPCKTGIVRWTKKLAGVYQVGMECTLFRVI